MVGLYMFLHCINLDYPNLTCQLRPWAEHRNIVMQPYNTPLPSKFATPQNFGVANKLI